MATTAVAMATATVTMATATATTMAAAAAAIAKTTIFIATAIVIGSSIMAPIVNTIFPSVVSHNHETDFSIAAATHDVILSQLLTMNVAIAATTITIATTIRVVIVIGSSIIAAAANIIFPSVVLHNHETSSAITVTTDAKNCLMAPQFFAIFAITRPAIKSNDAPPVNGASTIAKVINIMFPIVVLQNQSAAAFMAFQTAGACSIINAIVSPIIESLMSRYIALPTYPMPLHRYPSSFLNAPFCHSSQSGLEQMPSALP